MTFDAIRELNLEQHPEGGWYRRTFTAPDALATPAGDRPAATLIHFWLPAGEHSRWHVVTSDEVWMWHGPGALRLELGGTGDAPRETGETALLASPGTDNARQQFLVPAGCWQRTIPGDDDVLVSCLVTPGFDFADWRLAD
ncbi:cupin domain-containing protein [Paramicrobacterium chengjingii]|uniref:Cupin domain-containing protein n=1 Tax=Paramicrobacterium chengjingii TaxID=2769067 RepID=A0ABX6YK81_9MICO|nr:cupin domain-containing protein [Microbacterium chengjingii]QPZ39234.1 cupin domain-containing protein [Microbacterium chengjingii]